MCMTRNETEKQDQEQKFIMLPSVDFCFQELLEDKEILRGFCGAILCVPPEEIEDIILLPKQLRKKYPEEKYGILDVHVWLNNGFCVGRSFLVRRAGRRSGCWQNKTNTLIKPTED